MTQKPLIDAQEVRRAYRLLTSPGQVIEIRALKAATLQDRRPATYSGYFDNVESLLTSLAQLRSAMGIYLTLQPCHPDLLDRAENRLKVADRDYTTPDKYITCYRWLLIDCDPERVSNISSTDQEHDQARMHAEKVRDELESQGWPAPIEGDSGNGYHLLYPIDLQITDTDLVKRVLEGLASRYSTSAIKIDQTVFNPSRICKMYGTLACKGDDTARRSHRMSHIIAAPAEMISVSREQLEAIAAPAATVQPRIPQYRSILQQTQFNVEDWIAAHGVDTYPPETYQGGTRWILKQCPFCKETDKSAVILQLASDALSFRCQHDRCLGLVWQDLRRYYEPEAYTPKNNTPKKKQAPTTEDSETSAPADEEKISQATILVNIAEQEAQFFSTPGGICYARIPVGKHVETHPISERSGAFKLWLVKRFHEEMTTIPNDKALSSAMMLLVAKAKFSDAEKQDVFIRLGHKNDKLYIDLANDAHQIVEVDAKGWRIISQAPICFKRSNGMSALPVPERGGSLKLLDTLINASEDDLLLIKAWLIGCFHPSGPYPMLGIHGEMGSAKSTTTEVVRKIVDPFEPLLRRPPDDNQSLTVAAANNHVLALDNLSFIPQWMSDAMCRIATGAGDAYRQFYTNGDEAVFSFCRPIVFNGIEEVATRGDLLDRCILVNLPAISEEQRKSERDFWREFDEVHPRLLGAVLDAVSQAIRNEPKIHLIRKPRMADFATWITACETALTNEPGHFMRVYDKNRKGAIEIELEASPVGSAIQAFMEKQETDWHGKAEALLQALNNIVSEDVSKSKPWPRNARALSSKLKRLAPSLRSVKINVYLNRDNQGSNITLCRPVELNDTSSSDAKISKSDANGDASDANEIASDAKNSVCVTDFSQDASRISRNGDASDAKSAETSIYTISQPIQKNRIVDNSRVYTEDTEKLASLASLNPTELQQRFIEAVRQSTQNEYLVHSKQHPNGLLVGKEKCIQALSTWLTKDETRAYAIQEMQNILQSVSA